jgi:hypothetical protein
MLIVEYATTPAQEYVRLLRAALTPAQREFVREQSGAQVRTGTLTLEWYADLIQSLLTPPQRTRIAEQLEESYRHHGWISPEVCLHDA